MSKFTVYLAGTMDSLGLEKACAWREQASEYLEKWDIATLNPCRKYKNGKGPFLPTRRKDIEQAILQDLQDIIHSDCIFCYFPEQLSAGSCMEIFYAAHNYQKPVIVVAEDKHILNSIWMKYWATKRTKYFSDGIKAIIEQQYLWRKKEK